MPRVGVNVDRRRLIIVMAVAPMLALVGVWLAAASKPAVALSSPRRVPAHAAGPTLSLTQLAGQRIIYAYSGLQPPTALLAAVRDGEAGGVILFGPNIASPKQVRMAIGQLQAAALASPIHARLLILD